MPFHCVPVLQRIRWNKLSSGRPEYKRIPSKVRARNSNRWLRHPSHYVSDISPCSRHIDRVSLSTTHELVGPMAKTLPKIRNPKAELDPVLILISTHTID